ncbi:tryptophan synthase subunit beta [Aeropyrum camini SY1 = JCM 12091]|uniref:Tryptophan synthase subunit beta n=1 Tax=Aeropyrum camini SY1 = JCM 12091 TaxID=1198449 RepID=U3TBK4_9CREN|nr:tryptophan synthase subunit beta [Aeropyrum camini SY1 = JCM 12091]
MDLARFRFDLSVEEVPTSWYNILPDLPEAVPPPLNPKTGEPVDPSALTALFPKALIEQEVSGERYIPIPAAVREA